MAALGMAWINISILFLIPMSPTRSLMEVAIQCMAALSLAVAAKTLQPVVQGLELLQVKSPCFAAQQSKRR
jgi:hypothetical protein